MFVAATLSSWTKRPVSLFVPPRLSAWSQAVEQEGIPTISEDSLYVSYFVCLFLYITSRYELLSSSRITSVGRLHFQEHDPPQNKASTVKWQTDECVNMKWQGIKHWGERDIENPKLSQNWSIPSTTRVKSRTDHLWPSGPKKSQSTDQRPWKDGLSPLLRKLLGCFNVHHV